jgi:hypothetical protein
MRMKFRNYKVTLTFGDGRVQIEHIRHGSASTAKWVALRAYPTAINAIVEVIPW